MAVSMRKIVRKQLKGAVGIEPFYPSGITFQLDLSDGSTCRVNIIEALAPCTLSPVLYVRLPDGLPSAGLGKNAGVVLKLYDRRYLLNDRRHGPRHYDWSPEADVARADFLDRCHRPPTVAEAEEYLEHLERTPDLDADFHIRTGLREHLYMLYAKRIYRSEVDAYDQLAPLQGDELPRVYGKGTTVAGNERVGAILIEYIPSVTLDRLPYLDPPLVGDALRLFCEDAVAIGDLLHVAEVAHQDLHLGNLLIADEPRPDGRRRIVLIDLGICTVRACHASLVDDDAAWRKVKARSNEDGRIGRQIMAILDQWPGVRGSWALGREEERYYRDEEGLAHDRFAELAEW